MLAKKYPYSYYCLPAKSTLMTKRSYSANSPIFVASSYYPIFNADELLKLLSDFHYAINRDLKEANLTLDMLDTSLPAKNIVKKHSEEFLPKVSLHMIPEDGYKVWLVQNEKNEISFDLKELSHYLSHAKKFSPISPHIVNGVDISTISPQLWVLTCNITSR